MPHAVILLIKGLADTCLTTGGYYVGSGGYSLFSLSPSKRCKPNGSLFLPSGKCRECAIIAYWMTRNIFFLPDREKSSAPQVRGVKVDLSMVLS